MFHNFLVSFLTPPLMFVLFYFFLLYRAIVFSPQDDDTLTPFKTVSLGNKSVNFYYKTNDQIRINYLQLHLPFILDQLIQNDKNIIYLSNTTKYEILPFKHIYMFKNNKKVLIGKYKSSKNENETLVQEYTDGDVLSYGKKVRWSAKIRFAGGIDELKVARIIEGNLGKYEIKITGSIFTKKLVHEHTVFYTQDVQEEEEKDDDQICKEFERNFMAWRKRIKSW